VKNHAHLLVQSWIVGPLRIRRRSGYTLPQVLFDKIKQLPPQRLAEVEDFVDFLRTRENDQRLALAAAKASEASFAQVWDNDVDAAYDRM
jgi:hypothetical protein